MANYGGGIPQPGAGGAQSRKSLFAPYLPQASIPPLLQAGKLVIGTLRVNKVRENRVSHSMARRDEEGSSTRVVSGELTTL